MLPLHGVSEAGEALREHIPRSLSLNNWTLLTVHGAVWTEARNAATLQQYSRWTHPKGILPISLRVNSDDIFPELHSIDLKSLFQNVLLRETCKSQV